MFHSLYRQDNVDWYMGELTSRIVAKSGRPSDRHHLGKIILQGLRDDPEFLLQIDGGTGKSETSGSVLQRSIQCAICFRNMGLQRGDVIILMAPAHLDLAIPFYAALYLGIIVAPIDKSLGVLELESTFETDRPKIIFGQNEKRQDIQQALANISLDATIITFDEGLEGLSFSKMMEKYGGDSEDFEAANFDPDGTIAMLIASSGTTGLPKAVALTHKNMTIVSLYSWSAFLNFPSPVPSVIAIAPLQWLSTIIKFLTPPIFRITRVQSSLPPTPDHIYELINKYKPASMVISPTMMTTLLTPGQRDKCDFTCFRVIYLGGSAVLDNVLAGLKTVSPKTVVINSYGMSEIGPFIFIGLSRKSGCVGRRYGGLQYKLMNIETEEEILEPNVPGELWLKGAALFKGYYNNPKATADTVTDDGWFKTGDMLYRDENWYFYYVERIKLLLKYRNHQVSPVELEAVISKHPDVLDVAVTGIPHEEFGDLPVACVVRRPGSGISADDIKDLVKRSLTDSKQLRGGVVFMDELPLTASMKIHRQKLRKMVLTLDRE